MISAVRRFSSMSRSYRLTGALIAAALFAGSLLLRLFHLDGMAMFYDEAFHMQWAAEIWARKTRESLFIPELGKLLYIWVSAVAIGLIPDPLMAGRVVSALTGAASVVGSFLLGWRLFNSRLVGIFSGAAYALLPLAVVHERMALVDPMLSALLLWATLLGIETRTANSWRRQALLAFGSGNLMAAAVWTKHSGLIYFFLPGLAMGLFSRSQSGNLLRCLAACYLPFTLAAVAAFLMRSTGEPSPGIAGFLQPTASIRLDHASMWWSNVGKPTQWFVSYLSWPALGVALR